MYRYYVSQAVLKSGPTERPAIARLPAGEIESAVIAQARALLRQPEMVVGTWQAARSSASDVTEQEVLQALERIEPLWDELLPRREGADRPAAGGPGRRTGLGRRGAVAAGWTWCPRAGHFRAVARDREGGGMSDAAQILTVVIPVSLKQRGGRKAMVTPGVLALERRQDITLIKAVARAFRWRRMLETKRFGTLAELATAEKINASYVSRVLRLTLLAPDIVEAILDGRQPARMTLPGLMEPFPLEWNLQQTTEHT